MSLSGLRLEITEKTDTYNSILQDGPNLEQKSQVKLSPDLQSLLSRMKSTKKKVQMDTFRFLFNN